jgi:putative ABC transport system permease protein
MQAEAPEMLTLKMLHGTRAGLKNRNAIMLSETLARKLFANANPINKLVKIDNKEDVLVTGVYEDLPKNSAFKDANVYCPPRFIYFQQRMDQEPPG